MSRGCRCRRKLRKLDNGDSKRLWIDVVRLDWQGDLKLLRDDYFTYIISVNTVMSRSMYDRLKALNDRNLEFHRLPFVAARNRFDDELDWSDPQRLCETAARAGSVSLLAELVEVRKAAELTGKLVELAASEGNLDAVRWLHERMPPGSWSTAVMDAAARGGHLEIVRLLHEKRTEGCSVRAMNDAAAGNFRELLLFLHNNRTEGCTTDAMDTAVAERAE
ncbi:hypothetical protein HK105_206864 [Polyrhizophydium stewartii]|uniref:Ankyrin repeat protein n=1 Tax=Polyrhizophydium stewartii TaxID=2732419 RepID=A0ABR4N241_9FUNG